MIFDDKDSSFWAEATAIIGTAVLVLTRVKALYPAVRKIGNWFCVTFNGPWVLLRTVNKINDRLSALEDQVKVAVSEVTPDEGPTLREMVAKTYEATLRQDAVIAYLDDLQPAGIYEAEVDTGNFTRANHALCRLFGMSHQQMTGKGWLLGVAEEQRAECYEQYRRAINMGIPFSGSFDVINQETGSRIKCRMSMEALFGKSGKPALFKGAIIPYAAHPSSV